MNTIDSEFGFEEYISTTNYMPKLESFDSQLYPSAYGHYGDNNTILETQVVMTPLYDVYNNNNHSNNNSNNQGSSSPESMSSRLSPPVTTPPTSLTEKIANVNKLPESFLPEFHQYSKETYENGSCQKKRRRNNNNNNNSNNKDEETNNQSDEDELDAAEVRRQIHIQSEQKRRAQIKDGFEELRQHLPGCVNKKMSKAALLHRTVQHLQHLKRNQSSILAELERIMNENEQLKKFQESVLQKQALERMYQMGV
ncbi:HLH-domain-containing protein [Backusella circina FSU 941]|nr:HLH-domain-containing protein [Backusella circina FSU 941]